MSLRRAGWVFLLIVACQAGWTGLALSQNQPHHVDHFSTPSQPPPTRSKSAEVTLLDLELVNQDGEPVRFKSDIIGNRLVVIDFVYTTCKTACPIQTAIFMHLQEELGQALGEEVLLVSISIDPATDIPARLKAFGQKHNAKPGWVWLTGKKLNVDQVLVGLRAYSADIQEHPSMILVGDGRHGHWTRYYGFPRIDVILDKLDDLRKLRDTSPLTSVHVN